ncbi:ADP-ribosyltransferase [Staphylococcus hominis]|uniref:ADP-ribosyltransferase n=1 Tax=Staphylococcus hominis TaxID=1290 RepID=UPI0021A86D09|nr:ADP-ribosyltransferase [Staphylococcus hominis]MCT1507050.1 hypothetical protein [Staphylococcus hominis]
MMIPKQIEILRKDEKKWLNSLSDLEKDALRKYTDNDFEVINVLLRMHEELEKSIQLQVDSISSAICKFNLSIDIIAYRGVSEEEFKNVIKNGKGTFNSFESFKSTSLNYDIAGNFSLMNQENSEYDYILIFNIPKNARGAYIESISKMKEEKEFILDKQTDYKVKDILRKKKIIYAILEVV